MPSAGAAEKAEIYDQNESYTREIVRRKEEMYLPAVELHMEEAEATVCGYSCSWQARVEESNVLHQKAHTKTPARALIPKRPSCDWNNGWLESGRPQGLVLATEGSVTSACVSESFLCE